MRFYFTPIVVVQLEEADRWWGSNRPAAPRLLLDEVESAVRIIAELPSIGAPYANDALPQARRFLLRGTSFHLYYTVEESHFVIVAVWSAVRGHGPLLVG